jgi:hypothetical protein
MQMWNADIQLDGDFDVLKVPPGGGQGGGM